MSARSTLSGSAPFDLTMLRIATGLGLPRRQLCISQRLRSRLGCRIPLRQMGAHAREVTSELRLCHGANIDGTHGHDKVIDALIRHGAAIDQQNSIGPGVDERGS